MQFSKSTGNALHALIHLAHAESGRNVGIKELADSLGVSDSYLSKIMSKLRQDGIVRAVTGASGGYELARPPGQITFLDVVQVIEGRQQLYECLNINALHHPVEAGEAEDEGPPRHAECLVEKVMNGAERELQAYLRRHSIQWVLDAAAAAGSPQ
ncbi:transcriptional regulator, BadM/Rrf2 family [Paenibacillus sp. UNC496MF]|uniref:RrF2 family transcriptional regulator n=1 Tax=Paenibacillus sp. UNC496MF TaxID=1502753 RepID=UPI0008EB9131|nr:Rrf2 family transcriptional regulator [Paenibacillus sp. UNC496MF]SFI36444.1 transcriptional regulator, BadM/Rrf2 family [Paenibacillus sp. UNC496MF]